MIAGVLGRAGVAARVCADVEEFCRLWDEGAGVGVIAEESLDPTGRGCVVEALAKQPMWSDFPLIVLTGTGHTTRMSTAVVRSLEARGNITLLERPLRMLTLVSAVQSALRGRRRQYEMRRLLDETRHAVEQRDQFLATLAHELRNPLAPLRNALQIMKLSGTDPKAAGRVRDMMERQLTQMVRLVDDLLDVSRVTRGKIVLRRERVDLAAVIQNAVEESGPAIEAGRHHLTLTLPPDPVCVEGDSARLTQVVANLLSNAAKYTPDGGHVWLTVERAGGRAVIRVRDTGLGIPADMLPRVFQMFTQIDGHRDRSQGGLGIGLSLVKRLAEMHGGSVEAASAGPGRGSEFTIRLPLAADEPQQAEECESGLAPASPSRRVLVVDDNADAADSLSMLLSLSGHEVQTARDGSTALEVAARFRPNVILLDLGMPGMDGYETARRVRTMRGLERVTLVAQTGWGQAEDRRRTEEAGFDHHLVKPVDPATLHNLLAQPRAENG
jgi:signal transduction histidine kinase/CheY-like chemotaxis protein